MAVAPKDTVVVGQLAGVFGVKGWLKVRSHTLPESNIASYSPWWLRTPNGLKAIEVTEHKLRPQGLVVHIKGVDDRDVAAQFGRATIEVAKDQLPQLGDDEVYLHQLLGLTVVSEHSDASEITSQKLLGVVADIMETGANDVLVVRPSEGSIDDRERLIPYVTKLYVVKVDLDKGEIRVNWDSEF